MGAMTDVGRGPRTGAKCSDPHLATYLRAGPRDRAVKQGGAVMTSPYSVSVEDVRKNENGLAHAEFCIDQMALQVGEASCAKQREQLHWLEQAAWQQQDCEE